MTYLGGHVIVCYVILSSYFVTPFYYLSVLQVILDIVAFIESAANLNDLSLSCCNETHQTEGFGWSMNYLALVRHVLLALIDSSN